MELSLRIVLMIIALILAVLIVSFFALQLLGFKPFSLLNGEKMGEIKNYSSATIENSILNFNINDYKYLDTSGMIKFSSDYLVDPTAYISIYPFENCTSQYTYTKCNKMFSSCDETKNNCSYYCEHCSDSLKGYKLYNCYYCKSPEFDNYNYYDGIYYSFNNLNCSFCEDYKKQPIFCNKIKACMHANRNYWDTCVVEEFYGNFSDITNFQFADILNKTLYKCNIEFSENLNDNVIQKFCTFNNTSYKLDYNSNTLNLTNITTFYPLCGNIKLNSWYIYSFPKYLSEDYFDYRTIPIDDKKDDFEKIKIVMSNFRNSDCSFSLYICRQIPFAEEDDEPTMKLYEFFRDWNPTINYYNYTFYYYPWLNDCGEKPNDYYLYNFIYKNYTINLDREYDPFYIANAIASGLNAWRFINSKNYESFLLWNITPKSYKWNAQNFQTSYDFPHISRCKWINRNSNIISINCRNGINNELCDNKLIINVFVYSKDGGSLFNIIIEDR